MTRKIKGLSKKQARAMIDTFFSTLNKETKPKEIKKIKRLAMAYNIRLRDYRKRFCKKCFAPFPWNAEIRVKKGRLVAKCKQCGYVARWKLKPHENKARG